MIRYLISSNVSLCQFESNHASDRLSVEMLAGRLMSGIIEIADML